MDGLKDLENLIIEFYQNPCGPDRRLQIRVQLMDFEKRLDSWKYCIRYIQTSNNTLVSAFFLRAMETTVTRNWTKLSEEDKLEIQNSLSSYLFSNHAIIPSTISNKLMKLLVIIARNEWQTVSATFIPNLVNLVISENADMCLFGLSYLLIACEELLYPKEELSTERKFLIQKNFEHHVSELFMLLNGTFQKYKCSNVEEKIFMSVLNVYLQLFSWAPLSDAYRTETLLPIFQCSISNNSNINILALSVLNEILYKNCVPIKNIPLVINICSKLNEIMVQICQTNLEMFSTEYITKILEMLSLVFSSHWHRIESNMEPTQIMSLLSAFFKLSFSDITLNSYYTCLEIWCSFLEYLAMRNIGHVKQYESLLTSLLEEIIKKLQSRVDDEDEDDQEIFECVEVLQNLYLNNHANVIDLLAELIPELTFTYIFNLWNSTNMIYIQMLTVEGNPSNLNKEEMITMLRTFERSIQLLTSSHSKVSENMNAVMIKTLTDVVNLANTKCIHTRNEYTLISPELLRVHCELLTVIPVWLCYATEKDNIITSLFATTLPIIEVGTNHQPKLQIASTRLLFRLINYIKESNMLQPLFVDPSFEHLTKEAQRLLQCALCCWTCICKNEPYEERLNFLRNLFDIVTNKNPENFYEMTLMLKECKIPQSEGRELLFMALEPWLEYVIGEYPARFVSGVNEVCSTLMTFFLEAFRVLLDHMKPSFIEKVIVMFKYCIEWHLDWDFIEKCGGDKMISFFELLIQNPNITSEEYISHIISICCKISDVTLEYHQVAVESNELLCNILLHKWQFFYKGNLNGKSELNHKKEFENILEIVWKSIKDITNFTSCQSSLRAIEEINKKWNLYSKEPFRTKFLSLYLDALLSTLIEGMLNLTDEILAAIYHMAAVNFKIFYGEYIPKFLMETVHLTSYQRNLLKDNINMQTDMPTFVQTIAQLTNDIRSFQRENGYGCFQMYLKKEEIGDEAVHLLALVEKLSVLEKTIAFIDDEFLYFLKFVIIPFI